MLANGGMTWAQYDAATQVAAQSRVEARQAAEQRERQARGETTVGALLDEFLAEQVQRNAARHFVEQRRASGERITEPPKKNISDARLISIQRDTALFRKVVGDERWDQTEATAAKILKTWRDQSEALLFGGSIKPNTFNERIKIGRMFVGWAESNYRLERLPRTLKTLIAKYDYEPTAKAIPLDALQKIWAAADEREKTFIALGLNLGYYSKDISDLTADMIDGDYIAHTRAKTGVKVRYKLWGVTKALLAKVRTGSGTGRVFASRSGNPLNHYPPGKARVDIVRNDFYRLCCDAKIGEWYEDKQGKRRFRVAYSFSNLRDTSTTAVENFDRSLSDLFDSHRDARMARYYIDGEHVDTTALDRAIDHLEAKYNLTYDEELEKARAAERAANRNKGGRPKRKRDVAEAA